MAYQVLLVYSFFASAMAPLLSTALRYPTTPHSHATLLGWLQWCTHVSLLGYVCAMHLLMHSSSLTKEGHLCTCVTPLAMPDALAVVHDVGFLRNMTTIE